MADVPPDLTGPPASGRLDSFPRRTLRTGSRIHRLHHANLGPWWFGSSEVGAPHGNRFDLVAPRGSSYWALQPEAAFLETLARRPARLIPIELVDRFHLTVSRLPAPLDAANAPVRRSWGFGLTAEFHTTTDYRLTRQWAGALDAVGFGALIAIPRHDVTARLRSVTFFGPAGERVPSGWDTVTGPVPASLVDAMAAWGIRCLPIPFEVEVTAPPG